MNAHNEALRIFTTSVNNDPRVKSSAEPKPSDDAYLSEALNNRDELEATVRLNQIVEEAKSRETLSKDVESNGQSR